MIGSISNRPLTATSKAVASAPRSSAATPSWPYASFASSAARCVCVVATSVALFHTSAIWTSRGFRSWFTNSAGVSPARARLLDGHREQPRAHVPRTLDRAVVVERRNASAPHRLAVRVEDIARAAGLPLRPIPHVPRPRIAEDECRVRRGLLHLHVESDRRRARRGMSPLPSSVRSPRPP